jgi:hypothetical protein
MIREAIRIDHDHTAAVEAFGRDYLATNLKFDLPIFVTRGRHPDFRLAFYKHQEDSCLITAQIEARPVTGEPGYSWEPVEAPYATAHVKLSVDDEETRGRAALTLLGAMQIVAALYERDMRERDAEERRFQQEEEVPAWVGGDC